MLLTIIVSFVVSLVISYSMMKFNINMIIQLMDNFFDEQREMITQYINRYK